MNKDQLRGLIAETLLEMGGFFNTKSAEELMILTCAVESDLGVFIAQKRGKSASFKDIQTQKLALGIFEMEEATHDDIMYRWLRVKSQSRKELADHIDRIIDNHCGDILDAHTMVYNLKYAIIVARLKYYMVAEPIPAHDDVEALAGYWKKHYNTELGDGTIEKAVEKYKKLVLGVE